MVFKRMHRSNKVNPIYIDTAFYSSSKNICLLELKVRNRPGVLSNISRLLAEKGVNIVKVIVPKPSTVDVKESDLALIIEADHGTRSEDIVRDLKRGIKDVIDVSLQKSNKGFLFMNFNPILFIDQRVLLFPFPAFAEILRLIDEYGITFLALLARIGEKFGQGIYRLFSRNIQGPLDVQDYNTLSAAFLDALQALGFGAIEVVLNNASDGEVMFRIYNNFECSHYKLSREPKGYFTRAVIRGFYRMLWGREKVGVKELKCIARGDKYCEFHVYMSL